MNEKALLLVKEYMTNPIHNKALNRYSYSHHEGNPLCWDDITVYVLLEWDIIVGYWFDGNYNMTTAAAAGFVWDLIQGVSIRDVLTWSRSTLVAEWFEVSHRRVRASVLALMAIHNGYYRMIGSEQNVTLDALIDS